MDIRESTYMALESMRANKFRAFLTMLGIIIGVWAIIGVQTFISGLNRSVEEQLSVLGAGTFYVQKFGALSSPHDDKYRNRKDITFAQVQAVQNKATLVSIVSPTVYSFGNVVKNRDKKTNPDVLFYGANEFWQVANSYYVEDGRFLTAQDVQRRSNVCALGQDVVEKLFPFTDPIGREVRLEGRRFTVTGIFEEKGQVFGQSQDNYVVLPITTFEKYFGKKRSVEFAVKAKNPKEMVAAIDQVTGILRAERKVSPGKENDFEILTRDSLLETWNSITNNVFLGALIIAGMALLAGGIGNMNIMLVSVTERTKEIGIRKAVGATRREILGQFITEAIILCGVGGIIGVIFGVVSGNLVGMLINWPTTLPVVAALVGFLFSSAVGLISGIYPAVKASRLNPIEALRYE